MFLDLTARWKAAAFAVAAAVSSAIPANALAAEPLDASAFAYDAGAPLRVQAGPSTQREGVRVTPLTFASQTRTIHAELIAPAAPATASGPGLLFVHWLGDPATTNHREFEPDARALARRGATCLLIDAMWSTITVDGRDWFDDVRTPATDYDASIAQVVDLRRALDVLIAQPRVDASRIAYVAHDFGAMYGALLAGVDPRPQYYLLMAGTTSFAQWYLLGKPPADVEAYRARMAPLDPLPYLHRARARDYYFQFASRDRYINAAQARAFFESAPVPKALSVYDAQHDLAVPLALHDRLNWLTPRLWPTPR